MGQEEVNNVSSSYLAKALGRFRALKVPDRNPLGMPDAARNWGQNNSAYRIQDPYDRAVPGRTGKAEVVWEPERPTVIQMKPCDYDAIFPAVPDSHGA